MKRSAFLLSVNSLIVPWKRTGSFFAEWRQTLHTRVVTRNRLGAVSVSVCECVCVWVCVCVCVHSIALFLPPTTYLSSSTLVSWKLVGCQCHTHTQNTHTLRGSCTSAATQILHATRNTYSLRVHHNSTIASNTLKSENPSCHRSSCRLSKCCNVCFASTLVCSRSLWHSQADLILAVSARGELAQRCSVT